MVRSKHVATRTCLTCGQKLPQKELVRIVRTPEGRVEIDLNKKKVGRGAYLCVRESCWEQGLSKVPLERALRISIPLQTKEYLIAQYMRQQQELAVRKEA